MINLVYFLLGAFFFLGAQVSPRGKWNEECTSLRQMSMLKGAMAFCVALHHMAQKTCAPWHDPKVIVHGLDVFVPIGYLFVAVFLFCSGFGLYRSLETKPGYLQGFLQRRILPIVAAFYLSELIHLMIRAVMGEPMDSLAVLWYLSGLHMANPNAWYVIVIPFFYLSFYLAFRFCKREQTAIAWVFAFTLAYTLLGASLDHPNGWWMRGEWWYNSILLFPLGLLAARHEQDLTRFFRKRYGFWLVFSLIAVFVLYSLSIQVTDHWFGYYGETWGDPLRIPHRLGSALSQWLVCVAFVSFLFLFQMKVRIGNPLLALLGSVTLEFYLMHGIFVDLFGFSFFETTDSLVYIRDVPLYMLAVLTCSAGATALFRQLLLWTQKRKIVSLDR